jgi:hypothetical protein
MSVNYKRKHQWTRSTKERKERKYRKPHIDLHNILQKKTRGEKLSEEREKIRSMKIGGDMKTERLFREGILTGGVTLLSKGEKEKDQKRNMKMKTGEHPQREIPFSIDVKGGEKT